MTDLRFDSPPGVLPSYLRAVARARRADPARPLPDRRAVLPDVTADPARLARYAEVCGFRQDGTLPPIYPHLLAFPASLALMTAADFPLPLLGLVHTANTITVRRPLGARERLAMEVSTDRRRTHPRGTVFDVAAVARTDGEEVWSSRSTYLYRHATEANAARPDEHPAPDIEFESWWLPAASGRRYAAVSGDRNPIHLHAWTARPFGFRRAIAHGMWTKARVLAALGERLPAAADIEVSFRTPVELPSGVRLSVRDLAGRTDFALTGGDGVRTHLRGSVTAR
ncbi:MaoC/PaaZ C-terminal domain-containing protein [Streptomyces sp. IBSNAI002]|uniref:MaoC/PaaZ C-terminal domain-containing protein n=1 Tax=Streptomyces sp. IBSNAI002 TaxID=3457500 RepID=UPI003FCF2B5A